MQRFLLRTSIPRSRFLLSYYMRCTSVWVVFGALLTRSRPMLRWLHVASLVWGILTELLPWPCPLTVLENWLERNAGVQPEQGGFLLHYLDKLVYPDISSTMLTTAAVIICALNLAFYGRQAWCARFARFLG